MSENRMQFGLLVLCLLAPLAVGLVSGAATSDGVQTWYPGLVKPSFNPPSWVFGPVWTALYLMMGLALYLVWSRGLATEGVAVAVLLFTVQLLLNGLWSWLFFGWQMPGWAFLEIVFLWAAIGITTVLFFRVSMPAGLLMVPYWAWVTFASVLNFAIWRLNA